MQLIAGIDASLTGTSLCVLNEDNEIIHVATFTVPKIKSSGIRRLDYLYKTLHKSLKKISNTKKDWECKHASQPYPLWIFIEGYSFMSKGRSVFNLGELGGVFRLILATYWGGYYEIPPTSLKKFITGKGNSKKQVMLEQVFRKYGVGSEILTDDNQVDAYALARMGSAYLDLRIGHNLPKYQVEAFKGIQAKCVL